MDQSAFILRTTALLLLVACMTDAKVDIIGNQDVAVGDETLLLCKVNAEGEISWQKDREDVDTDEVEVIKVDESSSTLHIPKIKMSDAGKYTCHIEFEGGHSDEATMALFVYEGPSFGSTQRYHEFLLGQDGVVPCLVSGQPAVEVQWFRDHWEVPSNGEGRRVYQASDNSLRIREAARNDTGSYKCQAKIKGRPVSKLLPISVVINAAPTVRLLEEEMTVMSGAWNNVSLLCLVDGLPQPNITWTMPVTFDPSRHQFNSDRSELTIQAVSRRDYGEYACTAKNKVAEDSATIRLHVNEHPEVFLNQEEQSVDRGKRLTVVCNATGHPKPQLHWINKQSGHGQTLDSTSGRVRVLDGVLMIDNVAPSDGGLYSCMAVSPCGNASRDIRLKTQPASPDAMSVSPGPTSVHFSLQTPPMSGGTPITGYALHARQGLHDKWAETVVPASDPLVITGLRPYTSYMVRLAAINTVGVGLFSQVHTVLTEGIREPDSPVLSLEDMKVDKNSFSLPLRQLDNGGSPLTHYNIRYKDKEDDEWREKELSPDATSVSLPGLVFGTDYQLEVSAVNTNGSSSPAKANFTVGPAPVKASITKGGVVAVVMVIFLLILIAVDATCCYRNRCGLLMFIYVKLFGHKMPGLKSLEESEVATNGNRTMTLKGLHNTTQQQSKTQQTETTCDKASLTKHEKTPHHQDPPATDA